MSLYIAPKHFNEELILSLEGKATGIILGDLFCQKRMFQDEDYDLLPACRNIKKSNLKVVFQTQVYNTTRSIKSTLDLINKLESENLVDAVLIHDPGILLELRRRKFELWWDRFSFNRDIIPNTSLIKFLLGNGVTKVEVQRPKDVWTTKDAGIGVLFHVYGPNIITFGRICYTEYFMNKNCGRQILCRENKPFIASTDKATAQYEADGFCLLNRSAPLLDHFNDLSREALSMVDGMTVSVDSHDVTGVIRMFYEKVNAHSNSSLNRS